MVLKIPWNREFFFTRNLCEKIMMYFATFKKEQGAFSKFKKKAGCYTVQNSLK